MSILPSSFYVAPPHLQVAQGDILAFHEAHFSRDAVDHFDSNFLRPGQPSDVQPGPGPEGYDAEEDDDGLGYYPDGVKRTLTDEQIAIFRHSEMELYRRAAAGTAGAPPEAENREDGEFEDHGALEEVASAADSRKKKRRRKNGKNRGPEERPDLRKRTWDVVESGLESLDYDDLESQQVVAPNPAQRRRISYGDG